MQGCAPYNSSAGMLMSSTKIQIFSLGRAPNSVLPFFCSLASMANYTSLAFVWAEKFSAMVLIRLLSLSYLSRLPISADLPTPESPVRMTGLSISSMLSMR